VKRGIERERERDGSFLELEREFGRGKEWGEMRDRSWNQGWEMGVGEGMGWEKVDGRGMRISVSVLGKGEDWVKREEQ
jgi:hypothetical protein